LPEENIVTVNIKYYSISPSSSAVSLIGATGIYVWFADTSGNWVRGDLVSPQPTQAAFAILAVVNGGNPPESATYIDNIPTAASKDPFPPPPPPLTSGTSEATYGSQFASLVPRSAA
jgi:hypothetical protein